MSYKRAMDGGSLFKFETQLLAKSLGSLALEEYKKTDLMWSISSVLRFTFWVVFHIPLENFTPSDTYLIKRYGFERHKQISFCTNVVSPFREEQIEKLIFNTNKVIWGSNRALFWQLRNVKVLGQVERELHVVLSISDPKTCWVEIQENNWEGEIGVGRGRFGMIGRNAVLFPVVMWMG